MKTKLFLTLAGIMFGLHITAQEVQQFVGIYTIQEICKSCTYPMPPDTTDYEIEIKASSVDTFNIQLYLKEHGLYEAIGANITNDSTFQIPLQTFQNFDNSLHISGTGKVIQDSITINYNVGTSGGTLECTCKGTRKKESGLNRISDDNLRFKIFPNPVKELLQLTLPTTNNNIKIVDVQGKIVLHQTVEQTATINISHLPSGTYIITANEETQQFIKE